MRAKESQSESASSVSHSELASTAARRWIALALGVLVLAGLLALAVVLGRMPPFDRFVADPLFFKRCLVAHVNFSLVVWFYSFIVGLLFLMPGSGNAGWLPRQSSSIALAGVVMMLAGAAIPGTQPVLSNYIPTIDHWIFRSGQVVFGLGVLASFLDQRFFRVSTKSDGSGLLAPAAAQTGLRAGVIAFCLAAATLAISLIKRPTGVDVEVFYELVVWGAGHVLQLVSTIAMLVVWIVLLTKILGKSPVSGPAARILFYAMVLPWLIAPFLALQGTVTATYRTGFTHLMQWCIFPIVLIFVILCARSVAQAWRSGALDKSALADPRFSGFAVSMGLTLLGFALGAAIRGSNTMVPAHYHASLGAITVAFMAMTGPILREFGFSLDTRRLRRAFACQPALYGGGMLLFSAGFALAGAHGMGRKVYGAEQSVRSAAETLGLGIMGIGGLVAIAGGVLFVGIVAVAWRRGSERNRQHETELSFSEGRS